MQKLVGGLKVYQYYKHEELLLYENSRMILSLT